MCVCTCVCPAVFSNRVGVWPFITTDSPTLRRSWSRSLHLRFVHLSFLSFFERACENYQIRTISTGNAANLRRGIEVGGVFVIVIFFGILFRSLHQDRHVDTLKRRAVEFLSFNRNLLPMFPSVDQLWGHLVASDRRISFTSHIYNNLC